jgi:hypothetical protein
MRPSGSGVHHRAGIIGLGGNPECANFQAASLLFKVIHLKALQDHRLVRPDPSLFPGDAHLLPAGLDLRDARQQQAAAAVPGGNHHAVAGGIQFGGRGIFFHRVQHADFKTQAGQFARPTGSKRES